MPLSIYSHLFGPLIFVKIDASTQVLSPLTTTNVNNLKPSIVETESKIETVKETTDENLPTTVAIVIMNP